MEEEITLSRFEDIIPEPEEIFDKEGDLDIYTEAGISNYVDDDGISASEEGFMTGYLGA